MALITMFVQFMCILGLLFLLSYHWRRRELYRLAAKLPGPKPWPIIGNADIFFRVRNVEDLLGIAVAEACRHFNEPLNKCWLGPQLVVVATDPDYIIRLLNHPSASHKEEFVYEGISKALGDGIFTRNGRKWQIMRKDMMNSVQPKSLFEFQKCIQRRLEALCRVLDTKSQDGELVNILHHLKLFALDVAVESSMGMSSINETENNNYNFPENIERALENAVLFSISIRRIFGFGTDNKLRAWARQLAVLSKDILEHRKRYIEIHGPPEKKNLADLVLATGKTESLNFDETSELATDLLTAGMDTSGIAMGTTLLMLAIHQDAQEKAYKELKDIFGDSNRLPEEADLKLMVYLEMCLNESLRHCGPPFSARRVGSNIQLDDYVVPNGAVLILGHEMLLKNPKYWENPGLFYPEHFTPEAVKARPKGVLLPFNSGPRRCPAQTYSFQLMKSTVSTILRRYHLTSNAKIEDVAYKFNFLKEPIDCSSLLRRRTDRSS